MAKYLAYSQYKVSGAQWFPRVPKDWAVRSARRIFIQVRDPSAPEDEQLAATQKYGVIPQRLFMEYEDQKVVLALSGTGSFKHVEIDDFVISLRSFQGGIERCHYKGCVSPAYTVMRRTKPIEPAYFSYLLKAEGFISELQSVTQGIREGKNVTYEQFGAIYLPFPSMGEQKDITAFLDHETAKIDRLIARQERLIELLKEKRQAVISHAVTKGLNPDAPVKDSGVEWLGEVPTHWKLEKLKYRAIFKGGGTPSKDIPRYWGGVIPWVSPKDMKFRYVGDSQDKITLEAVAESSTSLIGPGRVLIVVRSGILQRTIPVAVNTVQVTLNQDMKAIDFRNQNRSELFSYFVEGHEQNLLLAWRKQGATVESIEQEYLGNTMVPMPPTSEIEDILDFLNMQLEKYGNLTKKASHAIKLLKEHRTALISAAVTGKIDVRGWQKPNTEPQAVATAASA